MCKFIIFLLALLNNTFIGTLLAGSLLAFLGLYLYKTQKKIDRNHSDGQEIRNTAQKLFTELRILEKIYLGQLNVYDPAYDKSGMLGAIRKKLEQLDPGAYDRKIQEKIKLRALEVEEFNEKLLSQIDLKGLDFSQQTTVLNNQVQVLVLLSQTTDVLPKADKEIIDTMRKKFKENKESVCNALRNIIEK